MLKKILYLLGSGATEAVIRHLGAANGLLPSDVQAKIANYPSKRIDPVIWDEITTVRDIEHLVSVLDTQLNYATADKVRQLYQQAILELSKPFSSPPRKNLYSVLLDYHLGLDEKISEETLLGFLTLNYEDILEKTIQLHFRPHTVDYGLSTYNGAGRKSLDNRVPIYKLHGSFNWINSRPIRIGNPRTIGLGNALWIPPGVDKRKDHYPFNLLWGKVLEELMECDVLRVIGCSLSRNDWGLIPILYTVQRFARRGNPISLEIIDFPRVADTIKDNYAYLQGEIRSLVDMSEFEKYFKRNFPKARKAGLRREIESVKNPFCEWLEAKVDHVLSVRNLSIETDREILRSFHYKEL